MQIKFSDGGFPKLLIYFFSVLSKLDRIDIINKKLAQLYPKNTPVFEELTPGDMTPNTMLA